MRWLSYIKGKGARLHAEKCNRIGNEDHHTDHYVQRGDEFATGSPENSGTKGDLDSDKTQGQE
ncbi:MAG TPA: hypothetical protein DCZ59_09090 [Bacteroidetes bacterium]|nr:hypothetical protein [Bacteroidota bacterium]